MKVARSRIIHKHFLLDAAKIRRAQKVLNAPTETATVERALDVVIAEHTRNRLAREANERFMRSGAVIKDVFAKLGK